jgi:uncharacterized integral membrane protein
VTQWQHVASTSGLGLSLLLIHIYITPIKRFLQGRGARLPRDLPRHRLPLDEGLVQYVLNHPVMLWFVGPMFAALTGLVFKEGIQKFKCCVCCLSEY